MLSSGVLSIVSIPVQCTGTVLHTPHDYIAIDEYSRNQECAQLSSELSIVHTKSPSHEQLHSEIFARRWGVVLRFKA